MRHSLRIVIADDDSDMLESLLEILRSLGHQVVGAAEDGDELVEVCRRELPDLILTDIRMPRKDGLEAILEINREVPAPAIVISGLVDETIMDKAAEANVMAYPHQAS